MDLAPQVDMVLVVGSKTSANSKRLADISKSLCGRGVLIDNAKDIRPEWFSEEPLVERIGVSAGASTPEFLVEEVIAKLVELSGGQAEVVVPERRERIRNLTRS
jgi:4-hydroxy-3-methylbut-2-enyl diphosphate reductase